MRRWRWMGLVCLGLLWSCDGGIGEPGVDPTDPPPDPPGYSNDEASNSGLRRLSIAEYRQSLEVLLGIDPESSRELLPEDPRTPFDNDFSFQNASEALIGGYELLAGDVAEQVIADDALLARVVPCEATGPTDAACFEQFLRTFGRRALRRPMTNDEVGRFGTLIEHAEAAGDFRQGVNAALRAFLQHPEFIYRVEIGTPHPSREGIVQLTGHEVAARLSFFLFGETPPDWLLDAADAGELDTSEGIATATDRLLDEDRAIERIVRFHGMLFGYEKLSRDGIFGDMHQETRALLSRVIFEENAPWTDVLLAEQSYLSPELAEHYGLDAPTSSDWVDYGDSGRRGLFSHGTFLSAVPKFGDTSPTQRGLLIRTQLFCQTIPLPSSDLMVDVDEPPAIEDPDACKSDNYYMSEDERCAVCHEQMDLIGFGLENFDQVGQFRETENGREDCSIDGDGEFLGVGTFNGPDELAELAVESGLVEGCMAEQLYRFAHGRTELDEHDEAFLRRFGEENAEFRVRDYIRAFVTSDAFRLRRTEEAP